MTIATKNGVPIIKDGSIATGCGCCGGDWYCCPIPCTREPLLVTIAKGNTFPPVEDSPYIGTFSVPFEQIFVTDSVLNPQVIQRWRLALPIQEDCVTPQIVFEITHGLRDGTSYGATGYIDANRLRIVFGDSGASPCENVRLGLPPGPVICGKKAFEYGVSVYRFTQTIAVSGWRTIVVSAEFQREGE